MDWQTYTAAALALLAACYAAYKILWPIIAAFRQKKSDVDAKGCCGCGDKPGLCEKTPREVK